MDETYNPNKTNATVALTNRQNRGRIDQLDNELF